MIRHIVFFSVAPGSSLDEVEAGLNLLGTTRHTEMFEVGRSLKIDLIDNSVDFIVYAEFADEAALHAYKADPIYAEATRRVRPLRERRWAADFISKVE